MIRQLVEHSAAYSAANLLARATSLVWLVVLPNFMSPADYGALGLIVTAAALVNIVVPLEVGQGMARHFAGAPETERKGWAASAWTFTLLMLTAAALAAAVMAGPLNSWLFGDTRYLVPLRLAILYCLLNSSFLFVQNLFRWDFRIRDYTAVTLISAIATLALSVGLAALAADPLAGVTAGMALGAAAGLSGGLLRLGRGLPLRMDHVKLGRMLRFSLPLAAAGIALFISTYVGRFVLNDLLSLTDVGLFTWASQLAAIPALLLIGVQGAVAPLVMKNYSDPGTPTLLARAFELVLCAELWICLALGLFTPDAIRLLGFTAYAAAGPLVMMLAPAMLMLQLYFFAPGFAVAERTDLQLLVSLAGAGAAIALSYVLTGAFGVQGAALAALLSSALFLVGWLAASQRLYPLPIRVGRLVGFVAMVGAAGAVSLRISSWDGVAATATRFLILVIVALAAWLLGFPRFNWRVLRAGNGDHAAQY